MNNKDNYFESFQQTPHGLKTSYYNPFMVKHRRRTSKMQLRVLEKTFETNVRPDANLRKILGEQLGMTPRSVQVWFQNRRAKIKKRKSDHIPQNPHSLHQTASERAQAYLWNGETRQLSRSYNGFHNSSTKREDNAHFYDDRGNEMGDYDMFDCDIDMFGPMQSANSPHDAKNEYYTSDRNMDENSFCYEPDDEKYFVAARQSMPEIGTKNNLCNNYAAFEKIHDRSFISYDNKLDNENILGSEYCNRNNYGPDFHNPNDFILTDMSRNFNNQDKPGSFYQFKEYSKRSYSDNSTPSTLNLQNPQNNFRSTSFRNHDFFSEIGSSQDEKYNNRNASLPNKHFAILNNNNHEFFSHNQSCSLKENNSKTQYCVPETKVFPLEYIPNNTKSSNSEISCSTNPNSIGSSSYSHLSKDSQSHYYRNDINFQFNNIIDNKRVEEIIQNKEHLSMQKSLIDKKSLSFDDSQQKNVFSMFHINYSSQKSSEFIRARSLESFLDIDTDRPSSLRLQKRTLSADIFSKKSENPYENNFTSNLEQKPVKTPQINLIISQPKIKNQEIEFFSSNSVQNEFENMHRIQIEENSEQTISVSDKQNAYIDFNYETSCNNTPFYAQYDNIPPKKYENDSFLTIDKDETNMNDNYIFKNSTNVYQDQHPKYTEMITDVDYRMFTHPNSNFHSFINTTRNNSDDHHVIGYYGHMNENKTNLNEFKPDLHIYPDMTNATSGYSSQHVDNPFNEYDQVNHPSYSDYQWDLSPNRPISQDENFFSNGLSHFSDMFTGNEFKESYNYVSKFSKDTSHNQIVHEKNVACQKLSQSYMIDDIYETGGLQNHDGLNISQNLDNSCFHSDFKNRESTNSSYSLEIPIQQVDFEAFHKKAQNRNDDDIASSLNADFHNIQSSKQEILFQRKNFRDGNDFENQKGI